MVYVIFIIVACAICVSLRYLENKRINDPHHYNSSNKSSDKSDVKSIQKKLVNAGYPIKTDGVYGVKTAEAVEKFQKSGKITKIPADYHRLCLRRGTTESWKKIDPVLGNGEIVFDSTKYAFKVGDGEKRFTELDYIGGAHKETSDTKY